MNRSTPTSSTYKRHEEVRHKKYLRVRRSRIHGRGVFAAQNIKKGVCLGILRGIETKRETKYTLFVEQKNGRYKHLKAIGPLMYLNHSSDPNAELISSDDGQYAEVHSLRSIKEGDEITIDYEG